MAQEISSTNAFFVWKMHGGSPSRCHADYGVALAEAKRLAEQCPGHEFLVLASVASAVVELPPVAVREWARRLGPAQTKEQADMDLHDPLADMGALYAEALEWHNRGDEFATVCMRLIERLAEVPITQQHMLYEVSQKLSVARAEVERLTGEAAHQATLYEAAVAGRAEFRQAFREQRAEVERLRGGIARVIAACEDDEHDARAQALREVLDPGMAPSGEKENQS